VALSERPGPASDLLTGRRLSRQDLLLAARAASDDQPDALEGSLRQAREIADRVRAPAPCSVHLLVALLSDRSYAGYRALDQCGVDIGRLRVTAMNVGLGQLGRRPIETRKASRELYSARSFAEGTTTGRATPVPVMRRRDPAPVAIVEEVASGTGAEETIEGVTRSAQSTRRSTSSRRTSKRRSGNHFSLSPRKYPLLARLGENLCELAASGNAEPVVGRMHECEQLFDILAKRQGNNPCLVGPPGVGKRSIVRALARAIVSDEGDQLEDKVLIHVPVAEFFAGTGVRGALAQKLSQIKKEVQSSGGRVVLVFDNLAQLLSSDAIEEV
jgi:ATP-dependent Clp protease ATP-binding subunit ClpC